MSAKYSTGVYQIRNLVNGKCYIGSASRSFAGRWRTHRHLLRQGIHHSKYLQRAWNRHGECAFAWEVVLVCGPDDCILYEQIVVDATKSADGKHGYNCCPTAGSTRGFPTSQETRAKISRAGKGRKASMEMKAKLSATNKGRVLSQEWKDKISAARIGFKASEATRAAMSASRRGKKLGPFSDEHREKIAASRRGRKFGPLSAEHRAKIGAAQLGKKHTAERRANMSAAAKRRRKRKPALNQIVLF